MNNAITIVALDYQSNDLTIYYSTFTTRFGECLVASTNLGICNILFFDKHEEGMKDLESRWPKAKIMSGHRPSHQAIEDYFQNKQLPANTVFQVRGTDFQIKVWNALLTIPKGVTTTYGQIAKQLNMTGFQAVGGAIGGNPIGYIVPCHRVIKSNGEISGYRWGVERKRAMQVYEGVDKR